MTGTLRTSIAGSALEISGDPTLLHEGHSLIFAATDFKLQHLELHKISETKAGVNPHRGGGTRAKVSVGCWILAVEINGYIARGRPRVGH